MFSTTVIFTLLLSTIIITPSFVLSTSDELRALLEFKKGIHHDPLGIITTTWNSTAFSTFADLDTCPSSFHGVVCDTSSNSITSISLDNLSLSGELKFSTLLSLTMLRNLSLSNNNFTGRLVPQLGSISTLQFLDLSSNHFIGRIPDRIHDLYNLQYLNLSNNLFSGGYPLGIRNLQQLRVLDLRRNDLWGDVGVFFEELRNVEFVDLSENRFTGELPSDVANVSSLGNTVRHLNLSGNLLGGRLFGEGTLELFQSLVVLDLGRNLIGGEVPRRSFSSLSNLRVLRLGGNQLFGEVPVELVSDVVHLIELDLSGNGFSGSFSV